jgi:hypothetical protein
VALLTLCSAALVAGARPASAQLEHQAGGYLIGSFPSGDWGKIAGFGVGLDATDIVRFGPNKPFAWRLSTGLLYNFSRTETVPPENLSPNSLLELETKNWSLTFGIGPELAKRGGPIVPFIYGTGGFDTYWTSSTLSGTAGGSPYETKHGDSRITFAWAVGAGLRRQVAEGYQGELSVEWRSALAHKFLLPDEVTGSGSTVFTDRASRQSDQIIVRIGTVFAD